MSRTCPLLQRIKVLNISPGGARACAYITFVFFSIVYIVWYLDRYPHAIYTPHHIDNQPLGNTHSQVCGLLRTLYFRSDTDAISLALHTYRFQWRLSRDLVPSHTYGVFEPAIHRCPFNEWS